MQVYPELNPLRKVIIEAHEKSEIVQNCIAVIVKGDSLLYNDELSNSVKMCLVLKLNTFSVEHNLLLHENRLIVPSEIEKDVIQSFHACRHFSTNKTKELFLQQYWLPKLRSKIKIIVDKCACKIQKSYGHNPLPSNFPFHSISNFEVAILNLSLIHI